MASIERTAYPRFKRSPSVRELEALYTPTDDELNFARIIARKPQPRFGLLLLLKAFQRLGYFPAVNDIPAAIVQHVRVASAIDAETSHLYTELRTLYRHHRAIRERLGEIGRDPLSSVPRVGLHVRSQDPGALRPEAQKKAHALRGPLHFGGGGGIRTRGGFYPTHAFQACDLNRSSTPPKPAIVTEPGFDTAALEPQQAKKKRPQALFRRSDAAIPISGPWPAAPACRHGR